MVDWQDVKDAAFGVVSGLVVAAVGFGVLALLFLFLQLIHSNPVLEAIYFGLLILALVYFVGILLHAVGRWVLDQIL